MGKLLSLLSRDDSNCCTKNKYDVFLDFENAQPTDAERDLFEEVQAVLQDSESILDEIQFYKGAGKEIREAIATPTPECQAKAWTTVVPLVLKLRRFYLFSTQLEEIVPKILLHLCSGPEPIAQHLDTQQALVKQFAEILEFVLKFDEYKMKTPAIQNDFSYYRRTLQKQRMFDLESERDREDSSPDDRPSPEEAYKMSLFYANATPMLRILSDVTSSFVKQNPHIPLDQTTDMLCTMARVCLRMLDTPDLLAQFERDSTALFVLRVMTGLLILIDHVAPSGVFVKSSNVDVKAAVKLLKDQPAQRSEALLNALRYTTKNLNQDSTPKQIKHLLAV
ncbi:hypothetical protein WDU94_003062 [Cyamophila willieti]